MRDTAAITADHGELLVVDDEPFLRDAVAASLRFLGFGVTTAGDRAASGSRSGLWLIIAQSSICMLVYTCVRRLSLAKGRTFS